MIYLPVSDKRCTQCERELSATTEHFNRRGCHLRSECKECQSQRRQKHYAKHVTEAAEYRRVYRAAHMAEEAEYARRYKAEHKAKMAEYRRLYRKEHPDYGRRYRMERPEVVRAAKNRRRARKCNLPDTFTSDGAIAALDYWRWRCAYCGKSLTQLSLFEDIRRHFDHFIPLSDPRPDNPGTVAANMLPACHSCNESKCKHNPVEWTNEKFGACRAKKIIARIQAYFAFLNAEDQP